MDGTVKDEFSPDQPAIAGDPKCEAEGTGMDCAEVAANGGTDAAIMACLQEVVEELNSTLELNALLRRVAARVKQAIGYDTFAVQLLDPLGSDLQISFGDGYPAEVKEHWRLGLGQGLVGTAAKTGQAVRVGDVRKDPRYLDAGENCLSELAIPLMVKSRVIGVLDVTSRQADYFTAAHQRFLTFLAGHVANAIENSRLYENLRQQTRTLAMLYEVSRELASILDREELLRRIAQSVKRLVNYQGFHVMLWNDEKQVLENVFSLRYDERIVNKGSMPLGTGVCGTAAALRLPIRVPNVHLDPRYVSCGDSVDVRSELVVPLIFKDQLIGVIDLESTEYNAFLEEHEQMLAALASYISVALENARLYEKVRRDELRLERDLDTAREIQKGLLPVAPPRVAGLDLGYAYAPARQLGGDIYDFLSYPDGRLAIAVGDVSGKATAAALYGSLAIGMLRAHVVEHPCEPAEMLKDLNEQLRQPRLDNRFVALTFAVYDPQSKILTVANAGFPRPRLARGSHVEQVLVDGVPLGLLPDITYEQKKLALQVGDAVVFSSDGIGEAMNRQQEEYGNRRLDALLGELSKASARQTAEEILHATDRHAAGNGRLADDRTVVVLKVTRS
ncbi:MAG: SpoIIE family protein phosphatase [Acidobacteria bacterium]|nr:SpoIIE family protein phosphatase [Acidobacteriota bacterium]